jgi:hypothetical protein
VPVRELVTTMSHSGPMTNYGPGRGSPCHHNHACRIGNANTTFRVPWNLQSRRVTSINSQASPCDIVIHSQGAPVANSTKPLVEGEIIILPCQHRLVLISGDIYFQGDVELLIFSSFMLFVALMNRCGLGIGTCIHACAQLEPMKWEPWCCNWNQ